MSPRTPTSQRREAHSTPWDRVATSLAKHFIKKLHIYNIFHGLRFLYCILKISSFYKKLPQKKSFCKLDLLHNPLKVRFLKKENTSETCGVQVREETATKCSFSQFYITVEQNTWTNTIHDPGVSQCNDPACSLSVSLSVLVSVIIANTVALIHAFIHVYFQCADVHIVTGLLSVLVSNSQILMSKSTIKIIRKLKPDVSFEFLQMI